MADGGRVRKLTLPTPTEGGQAIDDLLKDCAPATFGHNEKKCLTASHEITREDSRCC